MASAEEAHRKGSLVEAMSFYEKAVTADPSKKQPWARIAQAQFDARNYGAAITASQEVLQRDTHDVTAKSIMAAP
jgi:Tfp pilus assembly protein PilF